MWPNEGALDRLNRALVFWATRGFAYVALPWVAPEDCRAVTRPFGAGEDFLLAPFGGLVASGEQSFLDLDRHGGLPAGEAFIGWTPCFRREPVLDRLHQFAFIKAELFVRVKPDQIAEALDRLLVDAQGFFTEQAFRDGVPDLPLAPVPMDDGSWDIEADGVEVGSYGIRRTLTGATYLYGTALAEPRWSAAVELWRQKNASPAANGVPVR